MGFAQEMKDFNDAYETGTRIMLNRANTALVRDKIKLPYGADPGGTGSFAPGTGPGIGTTTAPAPQTSGGPNFKPTEKDIAAWTDYIGQGAAKRGMDPEVAIKVARSEGLAPGIWQSNLDYKGKQERSYGPFQMFIDGGLGNSFQKDTGLDPADPKNVLQTIDYALDHAKQNGWGAWHGWKGDEWAGINRSGRSDTSPYTYTPSGTAPAGVDQTQTSGIPDDERDDDTEEAAAAPAEGRQSAVQDFEITAPEVQQQAQLVAPVVDLEEQPMTGLYAQGGAIPDDTTHFDSGGLADLYAPVRAMNQQATPQRTGATGTTGAAPRIQMPSMGAGAAAPAWRNWGATGSPAQMKFRNRPVAAAPVAAAPAAAPAAQPAQVTNAVRQLAHAKAQQPSSTGHALRQKREIANWQRLVDQERAARGYARGGAVPNFNDWVGRETRMSGRAEEAGQGARDQAARRMNMRDRGVDSTAYSDPTKKFPARPAGPSLFKTPPPSGGGGGGSPNTAGAPGTPTPPQPKPGRLSDEYVRPTPQVSDDPTDRGAPGTRDPNDRGAPGTRDPNDRGAPGAPLITIPGFSAVETPAPEQGPPAPQASDYVPEWNRFARGGAIPDDDDDRPVMRSQRAESANYQRPKKARARTDPWEGLRTKTSEPVRKPKKQGSRNQGKRAKPKGGQSQRLPDSGQAPTPTARPDPTTGQEPPIPTPAPRQPLRQPAGTPALTSPLRQPAGTPSLPYDQRGAITETGNRGAQGQVVDGSLRRGAPGAMSPSTKVGLVTRPQNPNEGSAVVSGNRGAPGQAVRQLPNAVPPNRVTNAPPNNPPPTVPGHQPGGPDRGILHAGMSTIADFLDMLSPEDYARPVEDLMQLNIQTPVASGGPPGFRKGGYVNSPPNPGSTRALNPIKQMPPDVRKYAIPDDDDKR
jgi:hypothetical protein